MGNTFAQLISEYGTPGISLATHLAEYMQRGVSLNNYPIISPETDDTGRITRALAANNHVIIPESTINAAGFTIPDGKILTCIGTVTINATDTITVGEASCFIGPNTTVDASTVTTDDFSIVKLSKKSIVDLYAIIGYQPEGNATGVGTVAKGIDAIYSDFVNVNIRWKIHQCKYAFYMDGGASGSGNTINDSEFIAKYISKCNYSYYQAGSSQIKIMTSAYMEYCDIGYSLKAGLYGQHYPRFDQVTTWFENRDTTFRTRLGDVYIPTRSIAEIQANTDRYFANTTFHAKNGIISARNIDEDNTPNIQSPADGQLRLRAGNGTEATSEMRMGSYSSHEYETEPSTNDTPGGFTFTVDATSGHFTVEKDDRTMVFDINLNTGLVSTRNGMTIGNSSVGTYHLTISKGGVTLGGMTEANAPNNTIFKDAADSLLKYKDSTGTVKAVTLG